MSLLLGYWFFWRLLIHWDLCTYRIPLFSTRMCSQILKTSSAYGYVYTSEIVIMWSMLYTIHAFCTCLMEKEYHPRQVFHVQVSLKMTWKFGQIVRVCSWETILFSNILPWMLETRSSLLNKKTWHEYCLAKIVLDSKFCQSWIPYRRNLSTFMSHYLLWKNLLCWA